MTNREKLIDLLTERDGEVDSLQIGGFLEESPLMLDCPYPCKDLSCNRCTATWLNEEAKE